MILDLKSGYHQVEMAPEDKRKTAFSFGQGLWHFNVMLFGLCNAPSCFERLMEHVLEGMQWKAALVYLVAMTLLHSCIPAHPEAQPIITSLETTAGVEINFSPHL